MPPRCTAFEALSLWLPLQALLTILDSPLNKAGKVKVSSSNSTITNMMAHVQQQQQQQQQRVQVWGMEFRW
jgi:hypothetical protein